MKPLFHFFARAKKMRADLSHVIVGEPASGPPWFSEVKNPLTLFLRMQKKCELTFHT